VVIDIKGEIYLSTGDRRRALGRKVVCLDPLDLANGRDRWNPLKGVSPKDILYLQRTASALLPASSANDPNSLFHNRAVDFLTGIFLAALRAKKPDAGYRDAVIPILVDQNP
jgi:type IV secretion system protein VirD4